VYEVVTFLLLQYCVRALSETDNVSVNGKSKVHPITGHEVPVGEYSYSTTLSLTLALDGVWVVNTTIRPLNLGTDPVSIVQEAGWPPGPVWTGTENIVPSPDCPARNESLQRLSHLRRYTYCLSCLTIREL
jgi:hypothetical protein